MVILKRIFLLLTCLGSFVANAIENDYFLNPQLYSDQDLSDMLKEKTLEMCWSFGNNSHFRFVSGYKEVYFEIYLGQLPDVYEDFLRRLKHKFISNDSGQLIFSYKLATSGLEEANAFSVPKKEGHPDEFSYIVTNRRIIEDAHPTRINQATLESIIKTKKVLFYTGAGLSLASDVPAMNELNELLGLEVGERFVFSLKKAIEFPRMFAEKIRSFHNACLYSAPTPAHYSLRDLSLYNNTRLVTENLDCLHEASGIFPYRIDAKHLREGVGGESLAQFDYIICVGLSFDDRGFLGWFKEQNPQGKIVAVDVCQPSYLGDEDFWIQDDLQVLMPNIQHAIAPSVIKEKR